MSQTAAPVKKSGKKNKKSLRKKRLLRALITLCSTLIITIIALIIGLNLVLNGPSQGASDKFIAYSQSNGFLSFTVGLFKTPEEINAAVLRETAVLPDEPSNIQNTGEEASN